MDWQFFLVGCCGLAALAFLGRRMYRTWKPAGRTAKSCGTSCACTPGSA